MGMNCEGHPQPDGGIFYHSVATGFKRCGYVTSSPEVRASKLAEAEKVLREIAAGPCGSDCLAHKAASYFTASGVKP